MVDIGPRAAMTFDIKKRPPPHLWVSCQQEQVIHVIVLYPSTGEDWNICPPPPPPMCQAGAPSVYRAI